MIFRLIDTILCHFWLLSLKYCLILCIFCFLQVCYYADVFASSLFYSGFIKSSYEETAGFQLQYLCSQLVIENCSLLEPENLLQHNQHEKSEKFFLFVSTCASIFFYFFFILMTVKDWICYFYWIMLARICLFVTKVCNMFRVLNWSLGPFSLCDFYLLKCTDWKLIELDWSHWT